MIIFPEIFRSIEHFCVIWVVCVVLIVFLTRWGLQKIFAANFRKFLNLHNDESGAAYSLSFVMVLPIYVFLIALILETTMIFLAKMGTMYASYAAARSAVVHTTVNLEHERTDPIPESAQKAAYQGATQAMVPYSRGIFTGSDKFLQTDHPLVKTYCQAFRERLSKNGKKCSIQDSYIRKKYAYARKATTIHCELDPQSGSQPWNQELIVTMTYQAPTYLPYIGACLGATKTSDGLYVFEITTKTALANEVPQNETGSLGILFPRRF